MMPVFAVSGMEQFLAEAGENGWSVLGTVGSERVREKEQDTRKHRRGDEEEGKGLKKPVLDCHEYTAEGPTIVVLGKKAGIDNDSYIPNRKFFLYDMSDSSLLYHNTVEQW